MNKLSSCPRGCKLFHLSSILHYSGSEQWLPRPGLQCSEKRSTRKSNLVYLFEESHLCFVAQRSGSGLKSDLSLFLHHCVSSRCFLAVVMVMLLTMASTWASSFHCFVLLEGLPEKLVICAVLLDLNLCMKHACICHLLRLEREPLARISADSS